jgi:hypothetical protein
MMDSAEVAETFQRDGCVVLRGFYDVATEIDPILEGIRRIIALMAHKHGMNVPCSRPLEAMTKGYRQLVAKDRAIGGDIYDAVKQIPAFMTLVSSPRNSTVFEYLRAGAIAGLAAGGYGIRIDNPGELGFRAPWHQEFPAQLRSLDGVVFWSPLLGVTPEMGPVEIALGSQTDGVVPVFHETGENARSGAYGLRLVNEQQRLERYKCVAPLLNPGDLVLFDFLTLHQSGENRSDRPRWSMQFRYFNFNDPTGVRISWRGSFAAGVSFSDVLPELIGKSGQ